MDYYKLTAVRKKAKLAVYAAIKTRKLVKPETCRMCGRAGEVEAYWPIGTREQTYRQSPLATVRWLCHRCGAPLRQTLITLLRREKAKHYRDGSGGPLVGARTAIRGSARWVKEQATKIGS